MSDRRKGVRSRGERGPRAAAREGRSWRRVTGVFAGGLGSPSSATVIDNRGEEATAEAFATAVERWPADGVPPSPGAWLTTPVNRKAIDDERLLDGKLAGYQPG